MEVPGGITHPRHRSLHLLALLDLTAKFHHMVLLEAGVLLTISHLYSDKRDRVVSVRVRVRVRLQGFQLLTVHWVALLRPG